MNLLHIHKSLRSILTSILLVGFLLAQNSIVLANEPTFTDIDLEDNAYQATQFLFEEGIFQGYPDGSFGLYEPINRAELMVVMVRALELNLDPEQYQNCFDDVTNQWFAAAVCYGKDQGWIEGYEGNVFKPSKFVSLPEAIKIIVEPFFADQIGQVEPGPDINTTGHEGEWYEAYIDFVLGTKTLGIFDGSIEYNRFEEGLKNGVQLDRWDRTTSIYNHRFYYLSGYLATRESVAEFLMQVLILDKSEADVYDDYFKDELMLDQKRDHLVSEFYPCYRNSELILPPLKEYVNERYDIDPIAEPSLDEIGWVLFLGNEENYPYFMSKGFCVLENDETLFFGSYVPDKKREYGVQHLVRFSKEVEVLEEQIMECDELVFEASDGELPSGALYRSDPRSSEMIDCFYAKNSKGVYFMNNALIEGADLESFEVLTFPYSKDEKNVFYESMPIGGFDWQTGEPASNQADPKTFEVIPPSDEDLSPFPFYSKDDSAAYLRDYPISGDPENFEVIGLGAIPESWKENGDFLFEFWDQYLYDLTYSRDKKNWYLAGMTIQNIDTDTFEVLDFFHAKDKNNAYLLPTDRYHNDVVLAADDSGIGQVQLKIIEGADADSFESLGPYFSKDKDHVYFYDQPIPADPESASTLINKDQHYYFWLRTDNQLYKGNYEYETIDEVMNIADLESFEFINQQFAKDSQNVYDTWGHENHDYEKPEYLADDQIEFMIVENVDPETFHPIDSYANNLYHFHVKDGAIYIGDNKIEFGDGFVIEDINLFDNRAVSGYNEMVCVLPIESPYVAQCTSSDEYHDTIDHTWIVDYWN